MVKLSILGIAVVVFALALLIIADTQLTLAKPNKPTISRGGGIFVSHCGGSAGQVNLAKVQGVVGLPIPRDGKVVSI